MILHESEDRYDKHRSQRLHDKKKEQALRIDALNEQTSRLAELEVILVHDEKEIDKAIVRQNKAKAARMADIRRQEQDAKR